MTPADMSAEVQRLVGLIDDGIAVMRKQSVALAEAEMVYRKAKAVAWVECPTDEEGKREWTAGRREAWVNAQTAELRRDRDLAEAMRQAALEAVRARRAQLSALQSLLSAHRAEAEFVRTGPR
jgi:hypothetical protein